MMFYAVRPAKEAKMLRPRRGALALAVLGAGVVLSGCSVANSGTAAGPAAAASDTLRVVLQQEPPTLEACESNLTSTGVVVRSTITEPLIERNPTTGELEPKLATEWSTEDNKVWTFKLREGVKFQDGSAFTAEDAAATIDRAVNSKLGCNVEGYVFGDDDLGVKAVDAATLTVTATQADPILPLRISFLEVVPSETPPPRRSANRSAPDRTSSRVGCRTRRSASPGSTATGASSPPTPRPSTSGVPRAASVRP